MYPRNNPMSNPDFMNYMNKLRESNPYLKYPISQSPLQSSPSKSLSIWNNRLSISDKRQLFDKLKSKLINKSSIDELNFITDHIGRQNNYDIYNNKYIDDILAEICIHIEQNNSINLVDIINSQLGTISNKSPNEKLLILWKMYIDIPIYKFSNEKEKKEEKREEKKEDKRGEKNEKLNKILSNDDISRVIGEIDKIPNDNNKINKVKELFSQYDKDSLYFLYKSLEDKIEKDRPLG